jgi:UDP-N-acetylmuramate--alanine ligase
VEARLLAEGIAGHGHRDVHYCPDAEAVSSHLQKNVRAGDLVLTLGAGNVWQVGESLAEWLKQRG